MTTAAALRVWDVRRYRREPGPDERASRWAKRFAAGATATGCVWGLTASVILLTPDPAYHAFIAFVLGGMIAGESRELLPTFRPCSGLLCQQFCLQW